MIQSTSLQTERLLLRAPTAADTQAMLDFLGSKRAEFYGGPMTVFAAWHKFAAYFAAYVGQWALRGYGLYAIRLKDTGETVGMAGPYHPESFAEPEMSWLLTEARHEGKGYAYEACHAILDELFKRQGWTRLVSFIDTKNAASRALVRRLGATLDPETKSPFPGCDSYRHDVKRWSGAVA